MVRYRNLYCGVCAGGGSRKETVLDKYNGAVILVNNRIGVGGAA